MKDYKKILEGVVNIINTTEKSDIGFTNICNYISEKCPELTNEDERIKEKVITTIHLYYGEPLEDEAKEMIDWLEKQSKTSKVEETMREIEEKAKAFTEAHKGETTEEILAQMKGELMPTWSKEDERDFDVIYGIIYNSCNAEDASRLIAWLKSLKDRYAFKPSKEQMKALNTCIMQGEISYVGQGPELQSLYNDLKKLTE